MEITHYHEADTYVRAMTYFPCRSKKMLFPKAAANMTTDFRWSEQ